jgi:hypothetical protein
MARNLKWYEQWGSPDKSLFLGILLIGVAWGWEAGIGAAGIMLLMDFRDAHRRGPR